MVIIIYSVEYINIFNRKRIINIYCRYFNHYIIEILIESYDKNDQIFNGIMPFISLNVIIYSVNLYNNCYNHINNYK